MSYHPNFKNPRVIARIEDLLLFAWGYQKMDDMRHWSRSLLDSKFGKSDNPLSAYLRSILLICTSDKYSKDAGITKQYLINSNGIKFLIKSLSGTTSLTWEEWNTDYTSVNPTSSLLRSAANAAAGRVAMEEIRKQKYQSSLLSHMSATSTKHAGSMSSIEQEKLIELYNNRFEYQLESGEFEYEEKGGRDFTDFQFLPTQVRNPIASKNGYKYDYDIDCAQPTIISQFAKMKGMPVETPAISYYIHNKTIVRARLSKLLYTEVKTIKKMFLALFNNASIKTPYNDSLPAVYKALGCNENRLTLLKNDLFVTQFRADIKACWEYLAKTDNLIRREYVDEDGVIKRVRRDGTDYSATYRQQETIISRCIRNYLQSKSFKMISIHDGWNCQQEVDTQKVINHVYEQTGYKVNLTLKLI